jgi:hypothetical protein
MNNLLCTRGSIVLLIVVIAWPVPAADEDSDRPSAEAVAVENLSDELNLGFENSHEPIGWIAGGEGYRVVIDVEQAHTGARSLRFEFLEDGQFASSTCRFPVDVARGERLRLAGFVRTEGVSTGYAGLWMRVDGLAGVLSADNMYERGITGTTGWTRYEIELDIADEAVAVSFGALLVGEGTVWVDSFSFEFVE